MFSLDTRSQVKNIVSANISTLEANYDTTQITLHNGYNVEACNNIY